MSHEKSTSAKKTSVTSNYPHWFIPVFVFLFILGLGLYLFVFDSIEKPDPQLGEAVSSSPLKREIIESDSFSRVVKLQKAGDQETFTISDGWHLHYLGESSLLYGFQPNDYPREVCGEGRGYPNPISEEINSVTFSYEKQAGEVYMEFWKNGKCPYDWCPQN